MLFEENARVTKKPGNRRSHSAHFQSLSSGNYGFVETEEQLPGCTYKPSIGFPRADSYNRFQSIKYGNGLRGSICQISFTNFFLRDLLDKKN